MKIIKNTFFLALQHAANYIAPLLIAVYISRTVGANGFGLISFGMALVAYITILSDFGYNLTAVRDMAIAKGNVSSLCKIYSTTTYVKIILTCIGIIVYSGALALSNKYSDEFLFFFLFSLVALGQSLTPYWAYLAIGELGRVSTITAAIKILSALLCIFLIKDIADLYIYPLVIGIPQIIVAIWMNYRLHKHYNIMFKSVKIRDLLKSTKRSSHVFLANVSSSIYTTTVAVVLGFVSGPSSVGYYSAADKIIQAMKGVFYPVTQAIYPEVAQMMKADRKAGFKFVLKVGSLLVFVVVSISIITFIQASYLVSMIYGSGFEKSSEILKIMLPLPALILISNFSGVQVLLNIGGKKAFRNVIIICSLLCVCLALIDIKSLNEIRAAWLVLFTETLITLLMCKCVYERIRKRGPA